MTGIEGVLRRERVVTAAGLAVMVVLAWMYIWRGAGMGMPALDMTTLSLFPHLQSEAVGSMDVGWPIVIAMWWVMMIAMMTPSAAPLILLYGLVLRRHQPEGRSGWLPALLLVGYLAAWLAFAIVATALQKVLEPAGLISGMMLWSRSAALSATVLGTAGLYQLSPFKHACLSHCRAPVRFLTEHWRPGGTGSFILGARHGAYCVGCCWMLMALLFVGGVMNLVWIAVLTLVVLVEKLAPAGAMVGKVSGALLIAWAVATLLV